MISISEHTLDESLLNGREISIIDLGACLGEFSNSMNSLFNVKKSILVEANPVNFGKIENKKNYICLNRVVVPDSCNDDYISFFEDKDSPYNGSFVFDYFSASLQEHKIETIHLGSIISEYFSDTKEIDILKIDIEGAEYPLLEEIKKNDISRFRQISIEFHDFIDPRLRNKNESIINKIISCGFDFVSSKPANFRYGSEHYDTLFVRK